MCPLGGVDPPIFLCNNYREIELSTHQISNFQIFKSNFQISKYFCLGGVRDLGAWEVGGRKGAREWGEGWAPTLAWGKKREGRQQTGKEGGGRRG